MIASVKKSLRKFAAPRNRCAKKSPSSRRFWSDFNVTEHQQFSTADESLEYFDWRNAQYRGYIEMMPVTGRDGEVVLDYGCGPGHDLVGFGHFSEPQRLIGMDISPVSLAEAKSRLDLHGAPAELIQIREDTHILPLDNNSVDYIHTSGVLHHTPDPVRILREFKRVLRPDGELRVMVYNYNSLFLHLYVAYAVQIVNGQYPDLPLREAFRQCSDSENCPIAEAYRPSEFIQVANSAGFEAEFLGAAVGNMEMNQLPKRFDAIKDRRLAKEQRNFLCGLTFDNAGLPLFEEVHAGIDGCFRLRLP